MSEMTIKKLDSHKFEIKIDGLSVEDMNECFAESIAMTAFQTYPDDPQFLLEFYCVLIKRTQYYLNKLKSK